MYPTVLPNVLNSGIVRTGAPIANLMALATFLLIAGLMLLRTSRVLSSSTT